MKTSRRPSRPRGARVARRIALAIAASTALALAVGGEAVAVPVASPTPAPTGQSPGQPAGQSPGGTVAGSPTPTQAPTGPTGVGPTGVGPTGVGPPSAVPVPQGTTVAAILPPAGPARPQRAAGSTLAAGRASAGATLPTSPQRAAGSTSSARGGAVRATLPEVTGSVSVSRIDVSGYPQIGAVLTTAATVSTAAVRAGLSVRIGSSTVRPTARPLSPRDLEVVVVPEYDAAPSSLAAERASLTSLVQALPAQAQVGVLGSTVAGGMAPALSTDPTTAVRTLATLDRAVPDATPAGRLEAALAAFSPGAAVRRTLVLVTDDARAEDPATLDHLRRRLAASGTQLFVLDIHHGNPAAVDSLAADSGGGAARLTADPNAVLADAMAHATSNVVGALDHQYYLGFTDTAALPGTVVISLRTREGVWQTRVALPDHNPPPPKPWIVPAMAAPPPPAVTGRDTVLAMLAALMVISSLLYGLGMLVASRREPARARRAATSVDARAGEYFFVFLLPCLNEESVIRATVERLLSIPGDNYAVMVIDDDSDDETAAVVGSLAGPRVWLLRRHAPDARQGKGEALNAAVRELAQHDRLIGGDPDRVIAVVVDADGLLDLHALAAVTPLFADPSVGCVQTGVRINNRRVRLLARLQDMEFFFYTQVFQRGRRHIGSVGMGGNGQFMRLSALLSLGLRPWSRSLTEDLDLGVRMLTHGWRNEFCPTVAVHQQGLLELRRLIRQRTRWFQGHLQSWRLIPTVLRGAPRGVREDLMYHISSPFLLLVASFLTASFVASSVNSFVVAAHGQNPLTWWMASTYLLAFGPALAYSFLYWRVERVEARMRLLSAVGLAHLYVLYGLMWYIAGWGAVWHIARGRTGWAKTERVPQLLSTEPLVIDVTDAATAAVARNGQA